LAGYLGRWVDALISRITDAMLACPFLILAIALAAFLGPSLTNAMIAIGVSATPAFIRLTRAQVLAAKSEDYVEAARALGNPHLRIALRHIFPNIVAPLIVQATLAIAAAVIAEASLSSLRLGGVVVEFDLDAVRIVEEELEQRLPVRAALGKVDFCHFEMFQHGAQACRPKGDVVERPGAAACILRGAAEILLLDFARAPG